jgi:hypothetical protein
MVMIGLDANEHSMKVRRSSLPLLLTIVVALLAACGGQTATPSAGQPTAAPAAGGAAQTTAPESTAGFFVRVLLPLMRPALAAVAVLTMVFSWNAFFLPLLVLNSEQLYTLPMGITQFQGQFGTDWGKVLAFVSLALLPTIVFYLLAERQIIAGLTAGAVKG